MVGGNAQDMGNMIVIQGIEKHPAVPAVFDDMAFTQDAKLVGNGGAIQTRSQCEVADTKLAIAQGRQHPLAGRIAQYRKEPGHFGIPGDQKPGPSRAYLLRMDRELITEIVVRDTPPSDMCMLMHILRRDDKSNNNPCIRGM
jgi:hypothetical protein